MAVTTERLLRGVKRRISIPSNQALLDDADLLELADDIIRIYIVPAIISADEDYFVRQTDVPTVVDQADYDLPERLPGGTLRDVKFRLSDEAEPRDLVLIDLEDEHLTRNESGEPDGFYLRDDQLILDRKPSSASWTIEMWHEQRPSRLILLEDAAKVTGVDTATGVVTCASVPATFSAATDLDMIRGKGRGRIRAMEKTPTAVTTGAGGTVTFDTDDLPSGLEAGDYLSLADTSPLVQLPEAFAAYLETVLCGRRATSAIGDYEARRVLTDDEKDELKLLLGLITPRIRGETRKVINTQGLLRGRSRGQRRRRGYY